MSTINNLYIIGDSFCEGGVSRNHSTTGTEIFWADIVKKYFNSIQIYNHSEGSRDTQTILDSWVKLLPILTEADYLIVCIPAQIRYRLARNELFYRSEHTLTIRHIGQHGNYNIKYGDLEFYNSSFMDRDALHKKLIDNEILASSKASALNTKELIESLNQITKCPTYVFSWTRFKEGFKPSELEDKTDLEIKLGKWETQYDTYNETNGKYGVEGDLHWSEDTQKLFGNYIIDKLKL